MKNCSTTKMTLEKRRNGFYYYKKERIGKRVVSHYLAGGFLAQNYALFDEYAFQEKCQEREAEGRKRAAFEQIDDEISAFEREIKNLIEAVLLINGYRQTKSREWRKKRNGKERFNKTG